MIVVKDHKVMRIVPDNGNQPCHKIRFLQDGDYLHLTDKDSYFVYDLTGSKRLSLRVRET